MEEFVKMSECFADELKKYNESDSKIITKNLDEYLNLVSQSGIPYFSWSMIKNLIISKTESALDLFYLKYPSIKIIDSKFLENLSYQEMRSQLLNLYQELDGTPFTIQRIVELIIDPTKNYKSIDKFIRGLEKNLLIVSVIEPIYQEKSENVDDINKQINFPEKYKDLGPISKLLYEDNKNNTHSEQIIKQDLDINSSIYETSIFEQITDVKNIPNENSETCKTSPQNHEIILSIVEEKFNESKTFKIEMMDVENNSKIGDNIESNIDENIEKEIHVSEPIVKKSKTEDSVID
ncbi:unnamed protein product [Gordionus sp. m RMFG-2023]